MSFKNIIKLFIFFWIPALFVSLYISFFVIYLKTEFWNNCMIDYITSKEQQGVSYVLLPIEKSYKNKSLAEIFQNWTDWFEYHIEAWNPDDLKKDINEWKRVISVNNWCSNKMEEDIPFFDKITLKTTGYLQCELNKQFYSLIAMPSSLNDCSSFEKSMKFNERNWFKIYCNK